MTPYHQQDGITLYHGDCREVLATLPDESVHAVVTDPPYGLSFMGKRWDYDVPSVDVWQQCLRVLKPGGHLLAFAGTRTQHRMAVRIEDAGFEIRDMIAWVYGSGFPKSLDVSKAIDKAAGLMSHEGKNFRNTAEGVMALRPTIKPSEYVRPDPISDAARQWSGWGTALKPSQETITWARKPLIIDGEPDTITANLIQLEAKLWLLWCASAANQSSELSRSEYDVALSIAQWNAGNVTNTQDVLCAEMGTSQFVSAVNMSLSIVQSWKELWAGVWSHGSTSITSTRIKQTIAQKTLSCCLLRITPESMVRSVLLPGGLRSTANTAIRYACGSFAFCESILTLSATENAIARDAERLQGEGVSPNMEQIVMARKPLCGTVAENVLTHGTGGLNVDGCRVALNGDYKCKANGRPSQTGLGDNYNPSAANQADAVGRWPANLIHDGSDEVTALFPADEDGQQSAARFFYTAKADKSDRGHGNTHPTVKPVDLMRYLIRLVCPVDGLVLDPFAGSGTTLVAAQDEHCKAIGIEREEQYCEFIRDERLKQRRLF